MTSQSGGGGGYPGVAGDGVVPAGLIVQGDIHANTVAAENVNQLSSFRGGLTALGQGLTAAPDVGNVGLDVFYADGGGSHLGFRVAEDGSTWVRFHLKIDSAVTHTLGAYSGKSYPVYDASDTLIGYVPLYA